MTNIHILCRECQRILQLSDDFRLLTRELEDHHQVFHPYDTLDYDASFVNLDLPAYAVDALVERI